MQIFIIGSAYDTAKSLDGKRLNKQIIENKQIIAAINGTGKGWFNHPIVKMYKDELVWLELYNKCLIEYKDNNFKGAIKYSNLANFYKPYFHIEEYFTIMKRRLFTKDPIFYSQWGYLGKLDINAYYFDGYWKFYKDGKQINTNLIKEDNYACSQDWKK